MKNNKGFTLIELLVVIVLLGIIMAIAIRGVVVSMDKAKKETEKVFVSKLEDAIEQYIDLNKSDIVSDGISGTIKKVISSDGKEDTVNVYKMKHEYDRDFTFKDINSIGFIKESDLVNPANEDVPCGKPEDIIIHIYRDTDFVYYFRTDEEKDFECINFDGKLDINTLPETYEGD